MQVHLSPAINSIKQLPGGIVHIRFSNENLLSTDVIREIRSVVNDLQEDPVEGFLITLPDFLQTEPDFWNNLKRMENYLKGKRSAIIYSNSSVNVIQDNFRKLFRPDPAYRIFKTFEHGYEWLTNPDYRKRINYLYEHSPEFTLTNYN